MLRVVRPFTLNGREYKRGDDVADSDSDVVKKTPRFLSKCVAVADKALAKSAPAQDASESTEPQAAAPAKE